MKIIHPMAPKLIQILAYLLALIILTSKTNAITLDETNISAHVFAQEQALDALVAGAEQIQRSCIYSDESKALTDQLEELSSSIALEIDTIKTIRVSEKNASSKLIDQSKRYKSQSCNLFTSLTDTTDTASKCGQSQKAVSDAELIFSSVLRLQILDDKLLNTFNTIISLEAKKCMSAGIAIKLYTKHKEFMESIGGGSQSNLIERINDYSADLLEKIE